MLPTRLDPADVQLLAAAARWVPIRAAIADFGEDEIDQALPEQALSDLSTALGSTAVSPNCWRAKLRRGKPTTTVRNPRISLGAVTSQRQESPRRLRGRL